MNYETKTSHAYAKALIEAANYLLDKPEFDTETAGPYIYLGHFWTKEKFLKAAKALGSFSKEYNDASLKIKNELPMGAQVYMEVSRDKVCRLVQEAKYECEPLLSPEEEAELDASAS
jgi:hypothetical protein